MAAAAATLVAGCAGGSATGSGASSSASPSLEIVDCATLDQHAVSEMGQIAATLSAHGSRAVAEQTTKDLLANKRRAYQGGCISKAAYLKFLDETDAAIKAYKCPACVAAFDAERARVG
ncbi:MAG: hypothetical protein ACXVR1_15870 [Solirubrobacteraceae bacterium]